MGMPIYVISSISSLEDAKSNKLTDRQTDRRTVCRSVSISTDKTDRQTIMTDRGGVILYMYCFIDEKQTYKQTDGPRTDIQPGIQTDS